MSAESLKRKAEALENVLDARREAVAQDMTCYVCLLMCPPNTLIPCPDAKNNYLHSICRFCWEHCSRAAEPRPYRCGKCRAPFVSVPTFTGRLFTNSERVHDAFKCKFCDSKHHSCDAYMMHMASCELREVECPTCHNLLTRDTALAHYATCGTLTGPYCTQAETAQYMIKATCVAPLAVTTRLTMPPTVHQGLLWGNLHGVTADGSSEFGKHKMFSVQITFPDRGPLDVIFGFEHTGPHADANTTIQAVSIGNIPSNLALVVCFESICGGDVDQRKRTVLVQSLRAPLTRDLHDIILFELEDNCYATMENCKRLATFNASYPMTGAGGSYKHVVPYTFWFQYV